jgi:fluoroacetyl-CoA thioesterase
VKVDVRLEKIDGRRLEFFLTAHDGIDTIAEGTHTRIVIDAARFTARVAEKARDVRP